MGELVQKQNFNLSPQSMDEAMRFAEILAKSDIIPKDFKGNAGNVLVAIQWGMELGLKPMQAMQNIAVINGRPAIWGDAMLALVRASPLCEYVYESMDDKGAATCRVKRRGEDEQSRSFSDADAKLAGLEGKAGPWTNYKSRMKQMRARAFALRDVFPDVLKGMPLAEEVADIHYESSGLTRATPAAIAQSARPAIEHTPQRDSLLSDLEAAAKLGVSAYQAAFTALSKEDRKTVGPDEHARLKTLAAEVLE